MSKFFILFFLFSLPLFAGEWRDPRGLVWMEGSDCSTLGGRMPEADERAQFEKETGKPGSSYCVKYVVHHYFHFPKTPATNFEGKVLDFYNEKDPYGEFSNFSGFPVYVDGEWWSTSEHYFQAMKYETKELQDWVQFAPTPMEAANRGRDPKVPKRKDWEDVKDGFMARALMDKYTRHQDLTKLLLSTGTSQIYEHTKNDCYWADCGDRTGKNHLGLLLMKVRDSLR
jgi:ribA/ribD-fused uncharacterized protein